MALVSRIIGDCPKCGEENTFGSIGVRSDFVSRGCMACTYHERIPLPPVQKKILYLDQVFFSRAFRVKSADNQKYIEASRRLNNLALRQRLVVPYSSVHADESHVWSGYNGQTAAELWDFIKQTSGGCELETALTVHRKQLLAAFERFLAGEPPSSKTDPSDALPDDVHGWTDYVWIGLTNDYNGDATAMARAKEKSAEQLVALFPVWRASSNDFAANAAEEYSSAALLYRNAYADWADKIRAGDFLGSLGAHVNSRVIESMLTYFDPLVPQQERARVVLAFFDSEHFRAAPYQLLSTYAFAVLRSNVRNCAHTGIDARKKLQGLFLDIEHAATYAPYCDAIFLDNAMATMMGDARIGLEKRFGTKVFCEAKWAEFIAWLDLIDSELSLEHKAGLAAAYPDSIANPMEVMRARVARRRSP